MVKQAMADRSRHRLVPFAALVNLVHNAGGDGLDNNETIESHRNQLSWVGDCI